MTGHVLLRKKIASNNQKLDVSQFPAGQYTITLTGATEKITERFIIAR
jgi:flagellar biosynthesis/type III secretory pathway chaperone